MDGWTDLRYVFLSQFIRKFGTGHLSLSLSLASVYYSLTSLGMRTSYIPDYATCAAVVVDAAAAVSPGGRRTTELTFIPIFFEVGSLFFSIREQAATTAQNSYRY